MAAVVAVFSSFGTYATNNDVDVNVAEIHDRMQINCFFIACASFFFSLLLFLPPSISTGFFSPFYHLLNLETMHKRWKRTSYKYAWSEKNVSKPLYFVTVEQVKCFYGSLVTTRLWVFFILSLSLSLFHLKRKIHCVNPHNSRNVTIYWSMWKAEHDEKSAVDYYAVKQSSMHFFFFFCLCVHLFNAN